MSTPIAQVSVSNTVFKQKEMGLLRGNPPLPPAQELNPRKTLLRGKMVNAWRIKGGQ
jgi:hypothetical protein